MLNGAKFYIKELSGMYMCVCFDNFMIYYSVLTYVTILKLFLFFCHLFSVRTLIDKVIGTADGSRKQTVKIISEIGLPIKPRNAEI